MFPSYRKELICKANQLTGFYMVRTVVVKGLSDRAQRVTRNGQTFHWEYKQAVVPQGSITGPLFPVIHNK